MRKWQDQFNYARSMVEIGKKLRLIINYQPKPIQAELLHWYETGDYDKLKLFIKEAVG